MLNLLVIVAAIAQLPVQNVRPQIAYVYPPGAQAGGAVDVRIGVFDPTADMQIFVQHPGVTIEITGPPSAPIMTPPPYWFGVKGGQVQPPLPCEVPARITVPADVPPGPIRWQVANANGTSNLATFVIGDTAALGGAEPHEFIEPEKHDAPLELPGLPVTVSGRISKITEIDTYRFTVPTAGLVVCRLDDRLGQPFHGLLTIRDAHGKLVTDVADTAAVGAVAMFMAEAGQAYEASLNDVEFAGDRGYVYRLSIRRGPQVLSSLPLVLGRGETRPVEIVGWGVATGSLKLESITCSVTAPSVTGPAADAAGSFNYSFDTPAGPGSVRLLIDERGDMVEGPANDLSARRLTTAAAISGAFDTADPAGGLPTDRYQVSAKKGETLRLSVEAARFGSPCDPSIAVVSAEGKEIVRSDDLPGSIDAAIDFKAPADGVYDVIVNDGSGAIPSRADVYRLTVENAAELVDFTLQIPDRLDVALGGKADLPVKVTRRGLWKGPIALRFDDLPEGVAAGADAAIADAKSDFKLSLTGSETAAATARLATLVATVKVGERTIERRVGPLLVASTLKPRCTVKSAVQDGGRLVNRGTTYPADVIVERREGYEGAVTLRMAATQSRQRRGIWGGELVVPPGVEHAQYPIVMPEWLETSLTARMNLVAEAQAPDPQGNVRSVLGSMDGFIVMSLEGALLKLSHEREERVVSLGGAIDIPVRVARSSQLPETVRVEIVPGEELAGRVTAEPILLPVKQAVAVLRLRVADDPRLVGTRNLTIRGTALQNGRWPAVSETVVPLVIEAKATATAAK